MEAFILTSFYIPKTYSDSDGALTTNRRRVACTVAHASAGTDPSAEPTAAAGPGNGPGGKSSPAAASSTEKEGARRGGGGC